MSADDLSRAAPRAPASAMRHTFVHWLWQLCMAHAAVLDARLRRGGASQHSREPHLSNEAPVAFRLCSLAVPRVWGSAWGVISGALARPSAPRIQHGPSGVAARRSRARRATNRRGHGLRHAISFCSTAPHHPGPIVYCRVGSIRLAPCPAAAAFLLLLLPPDLTAPSARSRH